MPVFCTKCGAQNYDSAVTCASCQAVLPVLGYAPPYQEQPEFLSGYQPVQPPAPIYGQDAMQDWKRMGADKKVVAGVLAIVIGWLGIHKFILGYQTEGLIMLLVSVLSCGTLAVVMQVIGIIEGIMYLTKSDEEFVRTYIQGRKGWF